MEIKQLKSIFICIFIFISASGCKITLNEDSIPPEIRPLFFKDGMTLEEVVNEGVTSLKNLKLKLPENFNNDYRQADLVCSVTEH